VIGGGQPSKGERELVPIKVGTQNLLTIFFFDLEMASIGLRFEDRLEVTNNFGPWKERITLFLMENNLLEFVKTQVTPPIDAVTLTVYNLKDNKATNIIMDVVKDHVSPQILGNKSNHEMWYAVTSLHKSYN